MVVCDTGRRFVTDGMGVRIGAPYEVHVFPYVECFVEAAEHFKHFAANHERGGRDVGNSMHRRDPSG